MEVVEEERLKQLTELNDFISNTNEELKSILDTLGWSAEVLKKKNTSVVSCPLNPEHRMPQESLHRHLEKCSLHNEGYRSDEEFLSCSDFPSSPAVIIDEPTLQDILQEVSSSGSNQLPGATVSLSSTRPSTPSSSRHRRVPQTSDRLFTDLTAAQRSALHAYVVSRTEHAVGGEPTFAPEDLLFPIPGESKQPRPKSKLELLAEQRDAKRRRVNHKKIHTSRKTHTEILREVIRNQMEYLMVQDSEKGQDAASSDIPGEVSR